MYPGGRDAAEQLHELVKTEQPHEWKPVATETNSAHRESNEILMRRACHGGRVRRDTGTTVDWQLA